MKKLFWYFPVFIFIAFIFCQSSYASFPIKKIYNGEIATVQKPFVYNVHLDNYSPSDMQKKSGDVTVASLIFLIIAAGLIFVLDGELWIYVLLASLIMSAIGASKHRKLHGLAIASFILGGVLFFIGDFIILTGFQRK